MATRKEKVNAGLFLLIGMLLIGGSIAVVAGIHLERAGDVYLIKIPYSVGGLREGSSVKYLGVHVGRVKDVDFPTDEFGSVRVTVEITRRSTPLYSGAFATLTSNFLTGETSVELQGGAMGESRLVPGSLIEWRPTTLMHLEDSLPGVLDELQGVIARVSELLSPENRGRVERLVDGLDAAVRSTRDEVVAIGGEAKALRESLSGSAARIAESFAASATGIEGSVGGGIEELRSAVRAVESLVSRLEPVAQRLASERDGLPEAVAALREAAADLSRLARGVDAMVEENREGVRRVLSQVGQAARELEETAEALGADPSRLLFSAPVPERERGSGEASRAGRGGD